MSIWQTDNGWYVGYPTDHLEGSPPSLNNPIYYTGDRHICITGPNGSGKSMRLATVFMGLNVGWSVCALDLKGDYRHLTEDHRRKAGNIIIALAPFGENSHRFNPIASLPLDDDLADNALELAEAVIRIEGKDPHWAQAAQELVAALIIYVRLVMPEHGSFHDVRRLLGRDDQGWRSLVRGGGDTDPKKFADWKKAKPEDRDPDYRPPVVHERRLLPGMVAASIMHDWPELETKIARFWGISSEDREMHGVISTALVQTRWLDSRRIRRDLSGPPIDFSIMKERPVTVYIELPPRRLSTHSAWVRLIFASVVQKLMKEAVPGKVPVALLCDEFAALAGASVGAGADSTGDGFPTISKNMSVMRQYGIKLATYWQDLSQARRIFGDGFETFLANAGVFQSFAPQDIVTAEYLSRRTGQTTVEILQKGESRNPNPGAPMGVSISQSASIQYVPMPPLLPQDVRNMDTGFSVVFSEKAKGTVRAYAPWPTEVRGMRNIMARFRA